MPEFYMIIAQKIFSRRARAPLPPSPTPVSEQTFAVHISVNQQPTIGECSVKLYARSSPGAAETVVGTATCEAEDLVPESVWVGNGLDFDQPHKGITKLEVNWKAEYTNRLPMPVRPTGERFFISNAPVQLGITGGSFTISSDG